jgi:hypothetical protein
MDQYRLVDPHLVLFDMGMKIVIAVIQELILEFEE